MPNDERERALYRRMRVEDTAEIYKWLIVLILIAPLQEAVQYRRTRDMVSLITIAYTLTVVVLRVVAYLYRHRYPRIFVFHLLLF